MLDEPIAIVAYDARWPAMARAEIARLRVSLNELVVAYEHFGSTSVPNCAAKPILDILVGIADWPATPALHRKLVVLGYDALGEAGVPGRLYFRLRHADRAHANLAVTRHDGELWRTNLRVRELLRADPDLVRRYTQAKYAAQQAGATTLLAYSAHKAPFMEELVRSARPHSADTG